MKVKSRKKVNVFSQIFSITAICNQMQRHFLIETVTICCQFKWELNIHWKINCKRMKAIDHHFINSHKLFMIFNNNNRSVNFVTTLLEMIRCIIGTSIKVSMHMRDSIFICPLEKRTLRPFEKWTYYAVAMSVRPSVRPSIWVFWTFFQHALKYQFVKLGKHSVGGTTCRVWVSSQLGHFDLVYSQK